MVARKKRRPGGFFLRLQCWAVPILGSSKRWQKLYWIRNVMSQTVEAINQSIVTRKKMCYRWIQMTCFPWTSRCPTFLPLGELQYVGISISPIFRDVCISPTGTVVADRSFPVSVPLLSWTQLVPRQNSKSSKRKSGSFFWNPQNDRKGSM